MNLFLDLLLLALTVPVVVTLHEAGHALLARPAGFRLTSFGVGQGKPLVWHRGKGGVIYYVGRWVFGGGGCVAIPRGLGRGPRAALYHAGGALAQLAVAALLGVLPDWWWVDPVSRFNWLVLAWNLVPWRIGGRASDGWWLLALVAGVQSGGQQIHARRPVVEALRDMQAEVRSPLGTWYSRLLVAWTDLLVGQDPSAFFEEEHPESALAPEFDALHTYVAAETHRRAGRALAAMRLLKHVREAYGVHLPQESSDLVSLAEARVWLALDEPKAARQVLARLAGVGGVVGNEAQAILVEAALRDGTPDEIEALARRLASRLHSPLLDAAAAAGAVWAASRALLDDGRTQVSQDLARAARRAAARCLAVATPEDRATLILRLGEPAGVRTGDHAVM